MYLNNKSTIWTSVTISDNLTYACLRNSIAIPEQLLSTAVPCKEMSEESVISSAHCINKIIV
jgi:hypothetical protein